MTKKIYQLEIVLKDYNPKIWRRILINSDILLVDFHRIIQTTMGWTNSHLHLFNDGIDYYSPREFEVEETKDSRTVKLSEIFNLEKQCLQYQYDFGDFWEHEIYLEKIIENDEIHQIPCCIDGERSCPPEDCGGTFGYEELLIVMSDKKHEEYKETKTWVGRNFKPEFFDIEKTNKLLKKKDFGCIWLE